LKALSNLSLLVAPVRPANGCRAHTNSLHPVDLLFVRETEIIGVTADPVELLFEVVAKLAEASFELADASAELHNDFVPEGDIGNRDFPRLRILGRDKLEFG
jgi:hypothetical protein